MQKKYFFFSKIIPLLKAIVRELCLRAIFSFCNIKSYYWLKFRLYRLCVLKTASKLLKICHKLIKRQWRHSLSTRRHCHFFMFRVSLVKLSYRSKFHVNIITGSRVMTIFFYKGSDGNLEIGQMSVWVLPNIWRLKQVRNTKFDTNVSDEMLLNAAKWQGYSLYRFWVIQGTSTGDKTTCHPTPSPFRLGSNLQQQVKEDTIWYPNQFIMQQSFSKKVL